MRLNLGARAERLALQEHLNRDNYTDFRPLWGDGRHDLLRLQRSRRRPGIAFDRVWQPRKPSSAGLSKEIRTRPIMRYDFESSDRHVHQWRLWRDLLNMASTAPRPIRKPQRLAASSAVVTAMVRVTSGLINNQAGIDNIVTTVTGGNLRILRGRSIQSYSGRFGFGFMKQTITGINTNANLYSHTADGRANAKVADIETATVRAAPRRYRAMPYGSRPWPRIGSLPIQPPASPIMSSQACRQGHTSGESPIFLRST